MEKRKISIIMGIYNCASTLDEAIQSILNQSINNWELIMCDDGSTDETFSIAKKYEDKYPDQIIVLNNNQNMGLNYTLNKCLYKASGEYIARMDGDDISLPDRLKVEATFLDEHPEYAIVSTPMIYFDENGDWGQGTSIEKPKVKDFVFHAPFHCHAPCMIRKKAFLDVGGYTVDKKLIRFEDCNLWYKLYALGYRGYNLKLPLYKMRDDRNAYIRRNPKIRMRGIYVQFIGFKLVKMPIRYYPFLIVEFLKNLFIIMLPENIYMSLHRRKQRGQLS